MKPNAMKAGKPFELAAGCEVPRTIAGLWQLAAGHSDTASRSMAPLDLVEQLFHAGWTTFDCADIYTGVEELLGQLRQRLSATDRNRLRVHTKFVPDLDQLDRLGRADIVRAVERSCQRLRTERLDLVQFHWWDFTVPGYVETAGWLNELRAEGKIRHLGVTNFDAEHLAHLVAADIQIATNQVQYSLLDRRPRTTLVDSCLEHGVHLICYGTVAGGFLAERYRNRPAPLPPFENRSLAKYGLIVDEAGGWTNFQQLLETLSEIANKHHVGLAQVASRWVLEQPGVAAILIGTRHNRRLQQNRTLSSFALDADDHRQIRDRIGDGSGVPGEVYALERAPGAHSELMKTNLNRRRIADPNR